MEIVAFIFVAFLFTALAAIAHKVDLLRKELKNSKQE